MRPIPAILILAAGASARMRGADKLLQDIDGTPLILRATRAACAVSPEVIVALPPASPRRLWLTDTPARLIEVEDRAMSASIRAGLAACTRDALMIHLADMPEIGAAEMQMLADAWTTSKSRTARAATEDGRPGQPVIFARPLFPALAELTGDTGAKPLLRKESPDVIRLPGQAAITDLDTPESWAAWHAARRRDVP
ncbi:MAG: nucleotidyltransferase family protein [Pseudomonadota bacterium]